jgi:outer membrane protein OmpA-like peptidoglycan-associated protein
MSDYEWHTNILRFGVQISRKFDIGERQKILRTKVIILPDPPKPEPPIEKVKPALVKNFISEPVNILETIVTQTHPLLNYVFFDSASTAIQDKYINNRNIDDFNEKNLPKETLSIYYNLFDIIGSRLIANPKSKIKITGVTDGEELSDSKDRIKLAESRARNVAEYIINRWKVSQDRVSIESLDFPKLPTSREYQEGYQENRRVEITSNDPEILTPVIHSKFFEYTSTQDSIYFNFELNRELKLNDWNFSAFNGLIKSRGQIEEQQTGSIKISFPLNKELINYIGSKTESKIPQTATLTVNSSDGIREEKVIDINISKELNRFEIGRLNLIVFDFDRFDISGQNKIMINDFLKTSIKENSTVAITGSTDRLGELKYNYKLSSERANSVKNYIQSINSAAKITDVVGIGPSILPYDNNIPEGRFYCRTVLIEVKTPLK